MLFDRHVALISRAVFVRVFDVGDRMCVSQVETFVWLMYNAVAVPRTATDEPQFCPLSVL